MRNKLENLLIVSIQRALERDGRSLEANDVLSLFPCLLTALLIYFPDFTSQFGHYYQNRTHNVDRLISTQLFIKVRPHYPVKNIINRLTVKRI